jgi:hypothetical protein
VSACFDDLPSLYAFERDARRERNGLERHEHSSPRRLVYELQVEVPGYDILREVRIEFPAAGLEPSAFVDGPTDSPHRYDDGSMCMYHPRDPEALRWVPTDGLASLIDVVRTHLFQEEEYRHGLPWPGDEAPHVMTPRPQR